VPLTTAYRMPGQQCLGSLPAWLPFSMPLLYLPAFVLEEGRRRGALRKTRQRLHARLLPPHWARTTTPETRSYPMPARLALYRAHASRRYLLRGTYLRCIGRTAGYFTHPSFPHACYFTCRKMAAR